MFLLKMGIKRIGVKKEVVVPLMMLIFTCAYFFSAYQLSSTSLIFPRIFLFILLITSIYSIYTCIVFLPSCETHEEFVPLFTRNVVFYFFILTAFVVLLPYLGIYIAIPLFLIVSMFTFHIRDVKKLIIIALVLTSIIHLLFVVFLQTPLPAGILENLLNAN